VTSALVVGDPGAGRTTFVGLLYTAVVRFGSEEADRFRFTAERESLRRLEGIYGSLGDGQFPEGDLDREEAPLEFVFGLRRHGVGGWSRLGAEGQGGFDTVSVQVGGFPAGEVADLGEQAPVLDEPTRRLLRSPIVVALVNAALLPPAPGGIDGLAMARYDRELAGALETVRRFLGAERNRRARRLYPIFVVTQFDRIPEATLAALGAPAGPPSAWSKPARAQFGQQLLQVHLPETARFLRRERDSRVAVAPAVWFFSALATEPAGRTGVRIRRRSRLPAGGWEPEYPYEEYRELLLELGRRAHLARVPAAN
jgi:hypothetical protein